MRTLFVRLAATLLLAAGALVAMAQDLKIGSPAPPIKVSKWVKGSPVNELKPDQTYVVEFWATWCGPCRMSIPHLTEMAKKYEGKITFIGVSIAESDQADVEPFVKSMGDKMVYDVAMDQQDSPTARSGFMSQNWMDAANQNGIPTAFVVQKGHIAWIGHPMEMEPVLEKVVAGSWDTGAAEKNAEAAEKEREANMSPIDREMEKIASLVKAKDYDNALKETDKLTGMNPDGDAAGPFKQYVANVRLSIYAKKGDMDGFYGCAKQAAADNAKSPEFLNNIAWWIADPESKLSRKDYDFAIQVASDAVAGTNGKDSASLDTLAWAYYGKGDKTKAIETEQKALAVASDQEKAGCEKSLKTFQGS